MTVFYNEIEPYAVAWLRNLSDAGHIARGSVDARSVADLAATDVVGAVQFHTFAGIGAWSYALRLAGWPDDEPVWTGSCPCQPFSLAGKGAGVTDPRHLWPVWFNLIRECRPPVVFGEQVASPAGLEWLAAVRADLEGEGYAVGAADLCAAGVGAPHIRQRLFFGAALVDAYAGRCGEGGLLGDGRAMVAGRACAVLSSATPNAGAHGGVADPRREGRRQVGALDGGRGEGSRAQGLDERPLYGSPLDVAHPERPRLEGLAGHGGYGNEPGRLDPHATGSVAPGREPRGGADADELRAREERLQRGGRVGQPAPDAAARDAWSNCDWLPCRDGKARPVEPGTFPLAHGAPARVGRLRAYGNAIVPHVAAEFVTAFCEAAGRALVRAA